MPPWTTLSECADVAPAKSPRSIRAAESPRWTASQRMAAPQIPPPTTTTSNSRSVRADGLRCMDSSLLRLSRRADAREEIIAAPGHAGNDTSALFDAQRHLG